MSQIVFQYPIRDGVTGMELEAVRHQYTRVTPSYGRSLVSAVLASLNEAAAAAKVEHDAAVKIQATFRMHQQAQKFRATRQKACAIQRIYRGYATRRRLAHERATNERLRYLQTVFDLFATRIQACYRGYRSRMTTSNYYAQRAYLQRVTARAADVLRDAHRTRIEQDQLRTAEAQRAHALAYARRTAQMHHTVSTCSIPSVYQRSPGRRVRGPHSTAGRTTDSARVEEEEEDERELGESGAATEGDYVLAQVAVFTAGERLEDDIRANARAARHERSTAAAKGVGAPSSSSPRSVPTTAAPPPVLPSVGSAASPPPAAQPAAHLPAAERSGKASAVPWEAPSARAPQRPLAAPPSHSPASAPGSTRQKAHAASSSANVSSFHRNFGVRRHDCIEHELTCQHGVTQNGAATATFPGPLSKAKEKAALEHDIDQKMIKAVHGDAVFKVPAGRGKRVK